MHTNVCGPFNVHARGGYEYFMMFIDDYSRFGYVYLMHRKSNALDKFIELKAELENQLGKRIKALQYEGSNTPMGPSGPRSKFIYHDDTVYEG